MSSARSIYLADGLDALTMRNVAQHAGLGTMTTYRHFESKESLLDEIAQEGFEAFRDSFFRALGGNTPIERLWLCGELYLDFALANPRYYEAMFLINRQGQSDEGEVRSALQFLTDRITEVDPAIPDPSGLALSLFAQCHGMVSLQLAGRYLPSFDFPSFYRTSLKNTFAGAGLLPTEYYPKEIPT